MRPNRTFLWLAIAVVGVSLLVSCEPQQGMPQEEPPPPPSPEETRQAARKLWQSISTRQADQNESLDQWIQRSRTEIGQFKQRHTTTTRDGTQNLSNTAIQEINSMASKASAFMQQFIDEDKWGLAAVFNSQVLTLDPTNSRAKRARKKIEKERNKPKVVLTGFFRYRDTGELKVLLEVTDPKTKETESLDVEVGDEFYGYKLRGVIGKNDGVILEYLETRSRQNLMMGQR